MFAFLALKNLCLDTLRNSSLLFSGRNGFIGQPIENANHKEVFEIGSSIFTIALLLIVVQ